MKTVLGGTFDRFHKGHEEFLKAGVKLGNLTVGVTSDSFIENTKKVRKNIVQKFEKRKKAVNDFLEEIGADFKIKKIDNIYGDSVSGDYDAILTTEETRKNVEKINKERKNKGKSALLVVEVPYVLSEKGNPISSTEMRLGIIDRKGRMKKSARTKSDVRKNIKALLKEKGPDYGYALQKNYEEKFGKISLRLLYYHLRMGEKEGLWRSEMKKKKSDSSWGNETVRRYYYPI